MYFLLSPAKNLNEQDKPALDLSAYIAQPELIESSCELMKILKTKEPTDLMQLMKVSEKIAELNVVRNQVWAWNEDKPFTSETAKPAMYLFDGDVYTGLDAYSMNEDDIAYTNQHLGILSGLYGLIQPIDLILPYRLEMGTKLANDKGNNLYDFWGDSITEVINERVSGDTIINLASNEYFKVVKKKQLNAQLITPRFEDEKNGAFKVISFYAKKARGLMVRYAIDNKITDVEELKNFNYAGYEYCAEASDATNWTFRRTEQNQ